MENFSQRGPSIHVTQPPTLSYHSYVSFNTCVNTSFLSQGSPFHTRHSTDGTWALKRMKQGIREADVHHKKVLSAVCGEKNKGEANRRQNGNAFSLLHSCSLPR